MDGQVRLANPAFARFLGASWHEVLGLSLTELEALLAKSAAPDQALISLTSRSEPDPEETIPSPPFQIIRVHTPRPRTLKCQIRSLQAVQTFGGVQAMLISIQGITEEDELDRKKPRFLSAVAHELCNPMASVSGFAEPLSTVEAGTEVFDEVVRTLQEQSAAMNTLIDELLDVTRMGILGSSDLKHTDVHAWVARIVKHFARAGDRGGRKWLRIPGIMRLFSPIWMSQ